MLLCRGYLIYRSLKFDLFHASRNLICGCPKLRIQERKTPAFDLSAEDKIKLYNGPEELTRAKTYGQRIAVQKMVLDRFQKSILKSINFDIEISDHILTWRDHKC